MVNCFCQDGCYPAYVPATGIPSGTGWPLPAQEGDGTVPDASAVSAIASIDFTGITASAGALISICSLTSLTCVASGAAVNQFNAASENTLAANVAAAINSSTIITNAAVTGWNTTQLRNALYARASGSVVQIMTRAGSSFYNNNPNWQIVFSGTGFTGGSLTTQQFSGGVSGCWGYWFNDSAQTTMWPQALALYTYGILNNTQIAGPATSLTINDYIFIRSSRAGASFTKTCLSISITQQAQMFVDDGTWWESPAVLTLNLNVTANSINVSYGTNRSVLSALSYDNFILKSSGTYTPSWGTSTQTASYALVNVKILDSAIGRLQFTGGSGSNSASEGYLISCTYTTTLNRSSTIATSPAYGANFTISFDDVQFDFSTFLGNISPIVSPAIAYGNATWKFRNCTCIPPKSGPQPLFSGAPSIPINTLNNISVENCQGFSVGSFLGLFGSTTWGWGWTDQAQIMQQGVGDACQFRLENYFYVLEYQKFPTIPYPVPNNNSYCYSLTWSNDSNAVIRTWGQEAQRLFLEPESDVNSITLEYMLDPVIASSINESYFGLSIAYFGEDGIWRVDHSRGCPGNIGFEPLTSSSEWESKGGYPSYLPYSTTVTLSATPMLLKNITITFRLFKAAPSITTMFINPSLKVS